MQVKLSPKTRIEQDILGTVAVIDTNYWGASTQRALDNFPIGERLMPLEIIHALGMVKLAAAKANHACQILPISIANPIIDAASSVINGELDQHFPLKVWQTGSGTQTNMNVNEVIANKAIELLGGVKGSKIPVHPNDHVNMSQSSNDAFPTSMHIACALGMHHKLIPAIDKLQDVLANKVKEFAGLIKIGRTHLQDAVPLTLGQEFNTFIAQLAFAKQQLLHASDGLLALPLGGTAIGTGINAPAHFAEYAIAELAKLGKLAFTPATNKFMGIAAHDALANASASMKVLANVLLKLGNDVRWLSSGPRCGLGELQLPVNEPGSSIMPGKINPTQCEALIMVCTQVMANDYAISMANSQSNLQLNVSKPLIAINLVDSINLLTQSSITFTDNCLIGIKANIDKLQANVDNSLMLVTALSPHIGYDKAAKIAKLAHEAKLSLQAAAEKLGYLTASEFAKIVSAKDML